MVVALKVFKKTTPNGKITVYLGKRDFIDHGWEEFAWNISVKFSQGFDSIDSEYCDPVDGVVVIDEEYMRGRKVYGQLVTVYRYGREEDEVMGVKFSKEMILSKEQIYPMINAKVKSKAGKLSNKI